jgi:hypothetical protein
MDDNMDVLTEILLELRKLNARLESVETDIRNVRLNSSHPLLKLLFK